MSGWAQARVVGLVKEAVAQGPVQAWAREVAERHAAPQLNT